MTVSSANKELAERLRAIRESIRLGISASTPTVPPAALPEISLTDVHRATQVATHHADELGKPNPRPSGIANDLIQAGKGTMARSLDWMLRPQREFNLAILQSISGLAAAFEQAQQAARSAHTSQEQNHRQELSQLQTHLRELSELVAAELQRSETETRESVRDLRWSYEGTLARHIGSVEETRRRLNEEVRELNRRLAAQAKATAARPAISPESAAHSTTVQAPLLPATAGSATQTGMEVDYFALEKDFRGTEVEIMQRQSFYLPYFKSCQSVLDIACGRGEFLELMRDAGVPATGVDLDADMIGRCLEKGLKATQADVFQHLAQLPDASLGGIFCSQFVEHLSPADYTRLVLEAARKLMPGGVLAIETQNPECLAIFSKSFYIDPTHVKPIPAAQLRFLFSQAGLEDISTHFLSPAAQQLPLIAALESASLEAEALQAFNKSVENFNAAFFGGMDYSVIGKRPGG